MGDNRGSCVDRGMHDMPQPSLRDSDLMSFSGFPVASNTQALSPPRMPSPLTSPRLATGGGPSSPLHASSTNTHQHQHQRNHKHHSNSSNSQHLTMGTSNTPPTTATQAHTGPAPPQQPSLLTSSATPLTSTHSHWDHPEDEDSHGSDDTAGGGEVLGTSLITLLLPPLPPSITSPQQGMTTTTTTTSSTYRGIAHAAISPSATASQPREGDSSQDDGEAGHGVGEMEFDFSWDDMDPPGHSQVAPTHTHLRQGCATTTTNNHHHHNNNNNYNSPHHRHAAAHLDSSAQPPLIHQQVVSGAGMLTGSGQGTHTRDVTASSLLPRPHLPLIQPQVPNGNAGGRHMSLQPPITSPHPDVTPNSSTPLAFVGRPQDGSAHSAGKPQFILFPRDVSQEDLSQARLSQLHAEGGQALSQGLPPGGRHGDEAAAGAGAGMQGVWGWGGAAGQQGSLFHQETSHLLRMALPCIIIAAAPQVLVVVSQVFAGHLGTDALAAAAFGNTLWALLYYIVIGTSTALETLGAQAAGARDKASLVVWGMAGCVAMTLLGLPMMAVLWEGGAGAARLFGGDADTAAAVASYCRALVAGLLPQVWAVVLAKHLQAQSRMALPAAVYLGGVLFNMGATYMLVYKEDMGLMGVPLAASLTRIVMCVAMLVVVVWVEASEGTPWLAPRTWMRALYRWHRAKQPRVLMRFLSLGAPGGAVMGLECAAFEVTTALAGHLGAVQVAAHASAFSLAMLAFMAVPVAIAIATGIRVASLLGAGAAPAARACGIAALVWGACAAGAVGGALWVWRGAVGWLFTGASGGALVELVEGIVPLVALCQVVNGVRGASQGVLRGCGRQGRLLAHNLVGFCGGLGLGWWLTFGRPQLGLVGLWVGILVGVAVVAVLNLVAMVGVDWDAEVRKARLVRAIRATSRARRTLITRALQADEEADEVLVEALLEAAQEDPRPLHVIYQDIAPASTMAPAAAASPGWRSPRHVTWGARGGAPGSGVAGDGRRGAYTPPGAVVVAVEEGAVEEGEGGKAGLGRTLSGRPVASSSRF